MYLFHLDYIVYKELNILISYGEGVGGKRVNTPPVQLQRGMSKFIIFIVNISVFLDIYKLCIFCTVLYFCNFSVFPVKWANNPCIAYTVHTAQ